MTVRNDDSVLAEEFRGKLSWYAVKVRITHDLAGGTDDPIDQFSIRLVKAVNPQQAAIKGLAYAKAGDLEMPNGDGGTIELRAREVVEILDLLTDQTPGDGTEVWWRTVPHEDWVYMQAFIDDAATEAFTE